GCGREGWLAAPLNLEPFQKNARSRNLCRGRALYRIRIEAESQRHRDGWALQCRRGLPPRLLSKGGRLMANGTMPSSYQWPNWLNVLLAIWLFISPWVLQYAAVGTAAWNAWVVAIVIAALSIAALAKLAQWEEWVNLALGVWLIFSPWILGFSANANAMGNAV